MSTVTDEVNTPPQQKKRLYPAHIFSRASVVCPSCLIRFKEDAKACPNCQFDAHRVIENFPFDPPVMQRWMDNAKVFDGAAKREVDHLIDRLVKQFPQVSLSICTVELDDPVSLSEFGFWMMNACRLQEGQGEENRAWRLLLIIDVKRELLSLTPGYAVEAFMNDADWQDALKMMIPDMIAKDYRTSLAGFVKDAIQLLRKSAEDVMLKLSEK
ncbi:MAG: TPM domain-containing protein [Akkermansiaceae bacterium]